MFDFREIPFFDNHTHVTNVSNREIKPLELISPFLHGLRDVFPGMEGGWNGISPSLAGHIENYGVVKTLLHHLSQYLGCDPTLEAVVRERNRRSLTDMAGYTKQLYDDQHIIGEMADAGEKMGDPRLDCFPCRIFRLFQMDPLFRRLLGESADFRTMKTRYLAGLQAAADEGYAGIKCHVFEVLDHPVRLVEETEAESAFAAAVSGDKAAWETVYLALFAKTLDLCQVLDLPIHIHTGCTGNPANDLLHNCDPLSIAPFLNNPRFSNTTIVFLHANYPDIRHAALMTHAYPNVWVDLSWVLPWNSLNFTQCLEEVLGVAPHDKIMLGTGQHDIPEMAWVSAKIAKSALAHVMEKAVKTDLLSPRQAQETAEALLYRNAKRLYHF